MQVHHQGLTGIGHVPDIKDGCGRRRLRKRGQEVVQCCGTASQRLLSVASEAEREVACS